MFCDKCHAGQMVEYEKKITAESGALTIAGQKCDRCGHTQLERDEDVW